RWSEDDGDGRQQGEGIHTCLDVTQPEPLVTGRAAATTYSRRESGHLRNVHVAPYTAATAQTRNAIPRAISTPRAVSSSVPRNSNCNPIHRHTRAATTKNPDASQRTDLVSGNRERDAVRETRPVTTMHARHGIGPNGLRLQAGGTVSVDNDGPC